MLASFKNSFASMHMRVAGTDGVWNLAVASTLQTQRDLLKIAALKDFLKGIVRVFLIMTRSTLCISRTPATALRKLFLGRHQYNR
jgi:hypothetical protein